MRPLVKTLISYFQLRGGGGVQAFNFGKYDFEILVEREGQDTSLHLKGPCAQCCPCEASEQKWGQKSKSTPKEMKH